MSTYKSVDQSVKDIINSVLVRATLQNRAVHGRIVTLDDEENGTGSVFVRGGYWGTISVVQRDRAILSEQQRNFRNQFGNNHEFALNFGNIYQDFANSCNVWVDTRPVDLWNFDFMGTFFGETALMLKRFLENPSACMRTNEDGTLVAFTFQAIANGNLLVKMKNLNTWKDKIELYHRMKKQAVTEIADFYHENIQDILRQHKPECVLFEPVPVKGFIDSTANINVNGHSIVYGGTRPQDSTMMFTLYRARHDPDCTIDHAFSPCSLNDRKSINKGKRKMAEVEAEELIELETTCFMEEEEVDLMDIDSVSIVGSVISSSLSDFESELSSMESDDDESKTTSSGELSTEIDLVAKPSENESFEDNSQLNLFDHQLKMVQAVQDAPSRGYISAICGSGKSLAMITCCKAVETSIIFVPFKPLVEQFYHQYFANDDSVVTYRINSDHIDNIPLPHEEKATIYIANYDSAHRVAALNTEFDLVCWDEGHLATSEKRRTLSVESALEETNATAETVDAGALNIRAKKHVFWTATPNRRMKEHDEVFGEELFSYSFCEAVDDKVIKSFSLFISCYKNDDGSLDNFTIQSEKTVELTKKFIMDEGRKRILIYVNRVQEADGTMSVEQLRHLRHLFPDEWKVDYLTGKTNGGKRRKIFNKFCDETSERIHVIVSCRTISVGVDLPNCDAVVFAGTTRNVTEIVQRGCRPCRLTAYERATGVYQHAKIFFPINVSAVEVHDFMEKAKKDERVHQSIRNSPLEIPMMVLDLLKKGLSVDFDFSKEGSKREGGEGGEKGKKEPEMEQKRKAISVDFAFPYSEYVWNESSDEFAESLEHLCTTLKKQPCAIPGWEDMDHRQRAEYVSSWSTENKGKRPSNISKDPCEKVMGIWIKKVLNKSYDECIGQNCSPLQIHEWWKQAVENKLQEKPPCAIAGWEDMDHRQRAEYVSSWSTENKGKRPAGSRRDPCEKVMGQWVNNVLNKSYDECLGGNYSPMRIHEWWKQAVEKKLQEKPPCAIAGWEDMDHRQRAEYVSSWSTENKGKRPSNISKDPCEKVMGIWVSGVLQKSYDECIGQNCSPLQIHEWWKQAVENKLQEKPPCAIAGWEDMDHRQRAQYVSTWSTENAGKRPSKRSRDPCEKVMGIWVSGVLKKSYDECMVEDYSPMQIHDWWKKAVESKLQEKTPCAIAGWEDMDYRQRVQYVSTWSTENAGKRPYMKSRDPCEKVMGIWVSGVLQKSYDECLGENYSSMRIHEWWNQAVERKLQEKTPCAISGWEDMDHRQRAEYVSTWSTENGGKRPSKESRDPREKVVGHWVSGVLNKSYDECLGENYLPMRIHEWWKQAVEKRKK